jgi:hypothetical protein
MKFSLIVLTSGRSTRIDVVYARCAEDLVGFAARALLGLDESEFQDGILPLTYTGKEKELSLGK